MFRRCFLLLPVLISLNAQAQDDFRLAISAGPQLAWMTTPEKGLERTGSCLGFYYGALLDLFIADNYSFSTGFLISQVGGKLQFSDSVRFQSSTELPVYPGGTEVSLRNEYLEAPLTLRLMSSTVGDLRYFGQFGFNFGIRVRSRGDLIMPSFTEKKLNFSKDVGLFNMGLLMGAGIEHDFPGVASLTAGIQFSNGFFNVLTLPKENKNKARQNYLRLLLALNF
ncbi:MAG: outer membrane beta-barrel protein [Chitinophagales bacterium]|nr:PorT family protein [Chitinophagales bacterium]MDW8393021.1 outer membrane beta-barrel protein [Chitinophagales bacterium]